MYSTAYNLWTFTWFVHSLSGWKGLKKFIPRDSLNSPLIYSILYVWSIKPDRVNLVAAASSVCVRYNTNWDRKGWPGSEIQMYYGCPWIQHDKDNFVFALFILMFIGTPSIPPEFLCFLILTLNIRTWRVNHSNKVRLLLIFR